MYRDNRAVCVVVFLPPKPLCFFPAAETTRAGLETDHEKAFELHLKAANMGMPRAMFNTAVHYFEGTGIEQVKGEFRRLWLLLLMSGVGGYFLCLIRAFLLFVYYPTYEGT